MAASIIADLLPSWERHLRARAMSPNTITVYRTSLDLLDEYMTRTRQDWSRAAIEGWLGEMAERVQPASVSVRFRAVQQFAKWADFEDELSNATLGMSRPTVPEKEVPPSDPTRFEPCSTPHKTPSGTTPSCWSWWTPASASAKSPA